MLKVNVIINNTKWFQHIKNPNSYLGRKINKINLKDKRFSKVDILFTLLLSGSKEIKFLNNKFRKKNKATNVLSFPFQTKNKLNKKIKKKEPLYLGDIIINFEKIKNKKKIKYFKDEFDSLWIHGLIHLFGHDNKKNIDYMKMNKIEKKYLDYINDR